MEKYELIATASFGLEAVVKRELINLGFEITDSENGKITFLSDEAGISKANLWLRSADRVLLKVGEFKATTFDELFDKTKSIPWHKYISKDGKFPVDGKSVKSILFSISDMQAIVKKAIVEELKEYYKIDWFNEEGAQYKILASNLKDRVTLTIDTSGSGLHKRGYRIKSVEAPIKETLAAGLVLLSFWNEDRVLYDVFCGSGTIPIEAALIGKNIAPGLKRKFDFMEWDFLDQNIWKNEIKKAISEINNEVKLDIRASDISADNIKIAKLNAKTAGVLNDISFNIYNYNNIIYNNDYSIIISNPPYGSRLGEVEEMEKLYKEMGSIFSKLDTWSKYFIVEYPGFPSLMKMKADKTRKLYNGNIKVYYYQFFGPNPFKK